MDDDPAPACAGGKGRGIEEGWGGGNAEDFETVVCAREIKRQKRQKVFIPSF